MNIDKLVIKINIVPLLKLLLIKKQRAKLHELYYSLINKLK